MVRNATVRRVSKFVHSFGIATSSSEVKTARKPRRIAVSHQEKKEASLANLLRPYSRV